MSKFQNSTSKAKSPAKKSNNAISKKAKKDIKQEVTDRLIELMEQGTEAWQKTWRGAAAGGLPANAATGAKYRGINVVNLWLAAQGRGFTSNKWLTYRQAAAVGGQVRKGQTGTGIVFYSLIDIFDEEIGEVKNIPILKSFTVFNLDQIDNLPEDLTLAQDIDSDTVFLPIDDIEALIHSTGATIEHGGIKALYNPTYDVIKLPVPEAFTSTEHYYATAAHELIHWTGHESRLDRLTNTALGSENYAKEELIAELGAAFVAAHFEIVDATIENHASYLDAWLKVLKADKDAIFKAASAAQKAFDYLLKAA